MPLGRSQQAKVAVLVRAWLFKGNSGCWDVQEEALRSNRGESERWNKKSSSPADRSLLSSNTVRHESRSENSSPKQWPRLAHTCRETEEGTLGGPCTERQWAEAASFFLPFGRQQPHECSTGGKLSQELPLFVLTIVSSF